MRILLVRHGLSAANLDPSLYQKMADHAVPLADEGKEQLRAAGCWVDAFYSDLYGSPEYAPHIRLWTSPYRRTRQSADALMSTAGQWIRDRREHILLCEQQFGLFDGLSDDELQRRYPREHAHYAKCEAFEGRFWARMPLGESRFDVATRVHQAFGTFQRDSDRGIEDLVIICHGVTLRAFVMMWCHHTPEWFEAERNPKNAAIRYLQGSRDRGYLFEGFAMPKRSSEHLAKKS